MKITLISKTFLLASVLLAVAVVNASPSSQVGVVDEQDWTSPSIIDEDQQATGGEASNYDYIAGNADFDDSQQQQHHHDVDSGFTDSEPRVSDDGQVFYGYSGHNGNDGDVANDAQYHDFSSGSGSDNQVSGSGPIFGDNSNLSGDMSNLGAIVGDAVDAVTVDSTVLIDPKDPIYHVPAKEATSQSISDFQSPDIFAPAISADSYQVEAPQLFGQKSALLQTQLLNSAATRNTGSGSSNALLVSLAISLYLILV